MALVDLTANTVTLQGFQLEAETDMLTALTYLSTQGYTGVVNCQNISSTVTWSLALYDTKQNTSQTANIGDWIILKNGVVATVCPEADFATLYTAGS